MATSFDRRELSFVTLVLRLALGGLLVLAGAEKFWAEGSIEDWAAATAASFEGTYAPSGLVVPWASTLPFLEVVLGLALIAGLFTRVAVALTALQLVVLVGAFGILHDYALSAVNALYVVIACALFLMSRWNDYSLDALLAWTERRR